jgi:hypothetical protein
VTFYRRFLLIRFQDQFSISARLSNRTEFLIHVNIWRSTFPSFLPKKIIACLERKLLKKGVEGMERQFFSMGEVLMYLKKSNITDLEQRAEYIEVLAGQTGRCM